MVVAGPIRQVHREVRMSQVAAKAQDRTPSLVAAHRRLAEGCGEVAERAKDGKIKVRFASKIKYEHDGREYAVTAFDLMTFGDEISSRGYGGFRQNDDAVVYHLNAAGRKLFASIGAPVRGKPANPTTAAHAALAKRAADFVEQSRLAAKDAAFRSLGLAGARAVETAGRTTVYAENAEQLLIPVLKSVTRMNGTLPLVVIDIANRLGLERADVNKPFGTSARTLVEHVKHCVDYLATKGYVDSTTHSKASKLNPNMKGASVIRNGAIGGWPAFREIAPAVAAQSKAGRPSIDLARFAAGVSTMNANRLQAMYLNATKTLRDQPSAEKCEEATKVIGIIVAEYSERRQARAQPRPADASEGFAWPTTQVRGSRRGADYFDDLGQGMLSYFDYRVGNHGLSSGARQQILAAIFEQELPPVLDPDVMDSWGEPGTPERLRRMARSLAFLTRSAKLREEMDYGAAITDWEDDLDYLYDTYYVDRFDFAWPRADDAMDRTMSYGR
jgi:hypothetical protein